MNEEQKAQRLADWLASPEGGDPPEDLDPEVLATVFALRPDRAPAPRVSLDDIFAGVKEGPFATAEPTTDNVVEFPRPVVVPAARVDGAAAGRKRKAPSRAWMAPILGFGFAAAAAALLSFPMVAHLSKRELTPAVSVQRTPDAAPAPAAQGAATETLDAADKQDNKDIAGIPEATVPAAAPAEPAPAAEPTALRALEDAPEAPPAPVQAAPSGSSGMRPGAPPPPTTATATAEATTGDAAGEGGAAGPGRMWDGRPMEEKAPATSTIADMEAQAEAPAAADWRNTADDEADATFAAPKEELAKKSESRDEAPRSTTATRSKPAANAAAAPAKSAPATDSIPAARRERATALDYSTDWYRGDPMVEALYAAPLAAEAAGRWADAAALWQALVAQARADVAQDAALRAGKAWRAAGRNAEALAVIDAGLRRSSTNTAFRASLLVLRSEVLAALGRTGESKKAAQEADQLDADR